jgi:NAD(P)-dependent dehydrogenase (short-subunit alcohol dehydrogenase family)
MSDMNSNDDGLFSLAGRVALITGAAKGIGRVLALGLARHGADIVAIDCDPAVERIAEEVQALGRRIITSVCDITSQSDVQRAVGGCEGEFNRLDILVNNAGVNLKGTALEQTRANFERTINVNLIGSFLCCQAAAKVMRARQGGSIINISSIAGLAALGRGNNFYSATKGALIALTRELATEWAPFNIRVNALAPGWLGTDRVMSYLSTQPGLLEQMQSVVAMGRIGEPEELVGPVVFLASEASSLITGQVLVADGGTVSNVRLSPGRIAP